MNAPSPERSLAIVRCDACGKVAVWPRHACAGCGSTALRPDYASGAGQIRAVTRIHRLPSVGETTEIPYAVALIALDVGGQLMARVPWQSEIGDRVVTSRATITETLNVNSSAQRS